MPKIYIDQGHNPSGFNTGAEGNGLREQDVTYAVGQELAALLRPSGNYEVRLSRNSPNEVLGSSNASSLRARVQDANSWGADYFISIHTNGSTDPSARGVEAYAYSRDSRAFRLGDDIVNNLVDATGFPRRGMFVRPGLYVLKKTNMPATLVEIGFISNPTEAALMRSNPGLFARGIYNGIVEFTGLE
jgi:N-acetylmuramoyl-L-alanine amidase